MNLCFYHNSITSSWENPKGKAEKEVHHSECEWCISNREIIESAGGPEAFLEGFFKQMEKSIQK